MTLAFLITTLIIVASPGTGVIYTLAAGLSNGWAETEGAGGELVVRRKTLQLKFRRFGDGALRRDEDLKYNGYEWMYRASTLILPKEEKTDDKPDPKKK